MLTEVKKQLNQNLRGLLACDSKSPVDDPVLCQNSALLK